MARPLRVEYPGALYHVMARGNAYQDIFLNDEDRSAFLENLGHCATLHNAVCHAYCLMNNHFHLLLETPEGNLSKAMRDINGNYTQGFNARHKRVGHVLQGRYKALVIERETYFLEVARYIVNNPVQAGLASRANEWRWSNARATAGVAKAHEWLETDFTLGHFSDVRKEARRRYGRFVAEGVGSDPYDGLASGFILGSPQFVHSVWERTNGSEAIREFPREQRIVGRPSLEDLFEDTTSKKERDAAICQARFRCGYLATEIARHLGIDRTTVSKICRNGR